MDISERKSELRRRMRAWLREMSEADRLERSARISEVIAGTRAFGVAERIMAFLAVPGEPAVSGVIDRAFAMGKGVCLPRASWDDGTMRAVLVESAGFERRVTRHAIEEPVGGVEVELGTIDLVLAPGLGFDRAGHRLGRGAGFYDRFFGGEVEGDAPLRLGVCFAGQLVEEVAFAGHDERVDAIATENGVVVCNAARWAP